MNKTFELGFCSKRINLTVSMDEELYRLMKAYKAKYKVSLSAMVRDWMREDLERASGEILK